MLKSLVPEFGLAELFGMLAGSVLFMVLPKLFGYAVGIIAADVLTDVVFYLVAWQVRKTFQRTEESV